MANLKRYDAVRLRKQEQEKDLKDSKTWYYSKTCCE